ncbi:MAG: hypothetical protein GY723_11050 [bacterium]|nr:hypothetical protein [bacterium]
MIAGRKAIPLVAVVLTAFAAWALATFEADTGAFEKDTGVEGAGEPSHDEIDEVSRAGLERVLRDSGDAP